MGQRIPFEPNLAYHLRCLREDTMDPERRSLERLALVRDRAGRIQEIGWMLGASHERAVVTSSPTCSTDADRRRC